MNYIIRTVLVFFLVSSATFADKLEIKLNGKSTSLPYWAAEKNPNGAVILIRGGQQAQWSMLLEELAKKMSTNGWSAVLLNCNQGTPESWDKELPEVIKTLRQQKNARIIVLHYGEQLKQTLALFNKSKKAGIEGLVLLSAYDLPKAEEGKPELSMPVFDITGQFDYGPVAEQVDARQKAFAQNQYLFVQIPGAHHDYGYNQPFLLSFLYGWMLKLTEFKPKVPPVLVSYIAPIEPLMPKEMAYDEEANLKGFMSNPEPTQEITP